MTVPQAREGYLLLEDGRRFDGAYLGPEEGGRGEIVFTTVMTGYQEVLTDPSFAGQIVVMTAPMMGIYGVHDQDAQSRQPWVAGFLVRHLSHTVGAGSTDGDLIEYLTNHRIPTLVGADTRALTRHIRERRVPCVPSSWNRRYPKCRRTSGCCQSRRCRVATWPAT